MPISERAKQFAPFAALRGFGRVIKEEEKIRCDRPELSEDDLNLLAEKAKDIKKGQIVKVKYYEDGFIKTVTGAVSCFDTVFRKIKIIKKEISFTDVLDVEFSE